MYYPNLNAEIARKNLTLLALSRKIGMSTSSLSNKLNMKVAFSLEEEKKKKKALNVEMPIEGLFKKEETKCCTTKSK